MAKAAEKWTIFFQRRHSFLFSSPSFPPLSHSKCVYGTKYIQRRSAYKSGEDGVNSEKTFTVIFLLNDLTRDMCTNYFTIHYAL